MSLASQLDHDDLVPVPVPRWLVTRVYAFVAEQEAERNVSSQQEDPDGWSVEDFQLLLRDRRESTRRMELILDVLAEHQDSPVSTTDLVKSTGLTRGQIRGALSGFTRICKSLWPDSDVEGIWPMQFSWGPSKTPGQDGEAYYTMSKQHAARWRQARNL